MTPAAWWSCTSRPGCQASEHIAFCPAGPRHHTPLAHDDDHSHQAPYTIPWGHAEEPPSRAEIEAQEARP